MNRLSKFLIKEASLGKLVLPLSLFSGGKSVGETMAYAPESKLSDLASVGGKGFADAAIPLAGGALASALTRKPLGKILFGLGGLYATNEAKKQYEQASKRQAYSPSFYLQNSLGTSIRRGD